MQGWPGSTVSQQQINEQEEKKKGIFRGDRAPHGLPRREDDSVTQVETATGSMVLGSQGRPGAHRLAWLGAGEEHIGKH